MNGPRVSIHIALLAALAVLCAPTAPARTAPRPPNIVFMLIDDMGYADVGCNGSTLYETPNVDRLAREGMRFTQGYAACPVCSPTRASILTGKYPARLHLTDWLKGNRTRPGSPILAAPYLDQLPLEEVTLAEVLKQQGYATGHVGKWHLGGPKYYPEHQGFDVNVAGTAAGSPPSYFAPYANNGRSLPLPGSRPGEYLTDRLTDEALGFIEDHQRQPFFLYFAHYGVHIPIQARPDKLRKYEAKLKDHPPQPGQQDNPDYAAMVESVDDSLGRVLEGLKRLNLEKNTIVVFFSDNGGLSVKEGPKTPSTTNAPLRAGKGYLYEGGIREPLIVRWPGVVPAGTVCETPVCSVDFFPTFCREVGAGTTGPIDGAEINALLRNSKARLSREALYWHYPHFSGRHAGRGGPRWRLEADRVLRARHPGALQPARGPVRAQEPGAAAAREGEGAPGAPRPLAQGRGRQHAAPEPGIQSRFGAGSPAARSRRGRLSARKNCHWLAGACALGRRNRSCLAMRFHA
jgi:arylsulfatase A